MHLPDVYLCVMQYIILALYDILFEFLKPWIIIIIIIFYGEGDYLFLNI